MRREPPLEVTKPAGEEIEAWITRQLIVIRDAALEDSAIDAADAFSGIDHSSYTVLETFNPATVTLPELGRAVATLIQYIQNHGPRRV